MTFADGEKCKARACGEVVLGASAQKGTPFIEFYFRVAEGDHAGKEVRWTGYFHDTIDRKGKSGAERVIEALQLCGWEGEDVGEFADKGLHGLDANEVEIVIELDKWEDDQGNERETPRVKWVNRVGGGRYLNVDSAMKPDAAASFGEKMRGLVLKAKKRSGTDAPESFPFGANAPVEEKATGTGGKKRKF